MGGILGKEACPHHNPFERGNLNDGEAFSSFCDVEIDWNGCRKLSHLPPPGQHPRLLFTAQEIPLIVARFSHPEIGPHLNSVLSAVERTFLNGFYKDIDGLSRDELDFPSKKTIERFFNADETRNVGFLGSYIAGIMKNDKFLVDKAKQAALFYSKIILEAKRLTDANELSGKPFDIWKSNKWDLHVGWTLGGSSFALLYDLIFNELSDVEKTLFRKAITTAVKGRRSWGMGWPSRRVQSNWAAYHGDLLVLCAAVEDEVGFDREVYTLFSELMVNFLQYAVYESGHTVEDCYAINLGLREGSFSFLVMARRGHNVFNHPHYKRIWANWVPFALEPNGNGRIYGGSSGSSYDYPTSVIIAKYMFPRDPVIDFVYRHFLHQKGKYKLLNKMQSRLAVLAFALPALADDLSTSSANVASALLPLDFICRHRGKVVMTSDWSTRAAWFTLDARPDCFLLGHDVCSRGSFVFNADGRAWGICPDWSKFRQSEDYSLPHINGIGQRDKAPFVKLLDFTKSAENSTFSCADLTYAYNWNWVTWAKEKDDYCRTGFEREPNDPADFGFKVWWAPRKLYGERDVGFCGIHQWRKRFNTVDKVFRSVLMVRAAHPYVIVVDDVKKDETVCEYTWAMTTPSDVRLLSFNGRDAILIEEEGTLKRRLLLRNLAEDIEDMDCSLRSVQPNAGKCAQEPSVNQIVFKVRSTGVKFMFLLYYLSGPLSELPKTTWVKNERMLKVCSDQKSDSNQMVTFSEGNRGQTVMTVEQEMEKFDYEGSYRHVR